MWSMVLPVGVQPKTLSRSPLQSLRTILGDDEDYGYSEEFEDDDDVDFVADEEDNEPV